MTIKNILNLKEQHKKLLISKKLSTLYTIALLDYLFVKPHIAINDISKALKLSYQGANTLISQFLKTELLKEITGKKRDKRFSYWEYIALLSEGT